MIFEGARFKQGHHCTVLGAVGFVVVATLLLTWIQLRFGINTPPGASGDEPSYDSIAWELSHGRGYSIDYTDAEFRAPYDAVAEATAESYRLPREKSGPVSFRPPLLPVLGAVGNLMAGRQFYMLRLLNVVLMSATAGLIVWYLCRHTSNTVVVVILLLLLADVRTRLYARSLLTEPLACLLTTIMALLLLRFQQTARLQHVALAGVFCGLNILSRSMTVLWIPGLLLMIGLYCRLEHNCSLRTTSRFVGVFAVSVVLVIAPWSVRNTLLLQKFAPLGTQGTSQLAAAYSDIAWQHCGVWQNLDATHFQDVETQHLSGIQREQKLAEVSRTRALAWIRSNPEKLPVLAAMKVANEFAPRTLVEGIVLALSLVAVLTTLRSPTTLILLGIIFSNMIAVAATWSVEGRFLVPQLFCFYTLSGIGVQQILHALQRRTVKKNQPPEPADSGS